LLKKKKKFFKPNLQGKAIRQQVMGIFSQVLNSLLAQCHQKKSITLYN